jgi:aminocarboxymuconate-semialdehyde decarboxylase
MHPVDPVMATASLSEDQKADILGRTAARLFNVQA